MSGCDDKGLRTWSAPGDPDPTFDVRGRVCYTVDPDGKRHVTRPTQALVVSSLMATSAAADGGNDGGGRTSHRPVIDIDVPVRLVPSTTPGHSHLYIDVPMPWKRMVVLLQALADAGVVEQGYVDATISRGASFVRLPWVRKATEQVTVDGAVVRVCAESGAPFGGGVEGMPTTSPASITVEPF